jgi:RNA polymerase-binding transcription factor DksA
VDDPASDLDELRATMRAERRRLQGLVDALDASFDDLAEAADASPPDDEHDPEGHTIAFERAQLSARRDTYRHELTALAAAEARLLDDQAARCDECGEPIPMERRLAVPSTTRCVDCAASPRRGRLGRLGR